MYKHKVIVVEYHYITDYYWPWVPLQSAIAAANTPTNAGQKVYSKGISLPIALHIDANT